MGDYVDGDLRVKGTVTAAGLNLQNATITDAMIQAAANLAASKLEHQHAITYRQKTGADVVTETVDLHIARGNTGSVIGVDVVATTAPVGTGTPATDKKFTVNVLKGNQSTGFATVLTAVVTIDSTVANRQVVAASLVASPALAAGDTIRVVVTASGSTGSQGQGLVVNVNVREKADG
jgi:hypothetical protein